MVRDVRYIKPDNDNGAQTAPRITNMMNATHAAVLRAGPAPHGRTRRAPALPCDRRFGVLTREELRRAVAEVVG